MAAFACGWYCLQGDTSIIGMTGEATNPCRSLTPLAAGKGMRRQSPNACIDGRGF